MIHRYVDHDHFSEGANVFALDYYKPSSRGEDDFSRKHIWFYVYGDDEIEAEFRENLSELVNQVFVGDEATWDYLTLYPSHKEGEFNANMQELINKVSRDTGIAYSELIERKRTVMQSHELDTEEQKIVNLKDSIEIDSEVKGKNIVVVDNVSLSGTSLAHATSRLLEEGAENVACLVLGVSDQESYEDRELDDDIKASSIIQDYRE